MARGGKRPGAGRKPGALNKRTQEIAAAATAEGMTPLEFLLNTMRDPTKEYAQRLTAARDAAPYVHPRLASVEHSGNQQNPVSFIIATGVPRD
jgi:hypothetical protein